MFERFCIYAECSKTFVITNVNDPKKFCSMSCAARYNNSRRAPRTEESKLLVSLKLKGRSNPKKGSGIFGFKERRCSYFNELFAAKGAKKFCSEVCYKTSHSERMSKWLKENRSHLKGRSAPSYMEKSFAEWLEANGVSQGRCGYLTEVKFNIRGTNKRGWADFVFPRHRLIVELDGSHHRNRQDLDLIRDQSLQERGWTVVRISHTEYRKGTRISEIRDLLNLEVPRGIEPRTVHPTFNGPA